MSNQQNDHLIESLQDEVKYLQGISGDNFREALKLRGIISELTEALKCYNLNFPCPWPEIAQQVTSGCSMKGDDCPICQIVDKYAR